MRTVRVGTIVWGVILLVFAAAAFSVAVFDLREFQSQAVVWVVTGLGGVLVLAAIVALIARAMASGAAEVAPKPEARPEARPEPELPTSAGSEPATPTKAGNSKSATGTATAKKGQPVD